MENSKLLITGGTGSFGNAILEGYIKSSFSEIIIFSRDEKKQDDMRKKYKNKKIKFCLGDVRDPDSLRNATKGVDYIFHAAALKQVPSCEFYPMEAIKTNIIGTDNLLKISIENEIKKVVCLSTDKAVYPINTMGLTKSLMEKVMSSYTKKDSSSKTLICATRYGNVMASRGSVIPLFVKQILENQPITITNPEMTRFMMSLDEAVNLVDYAFKNGSRGDIFVQKSNAASVKTIAEALLSLFNKPNHPINIIGTRHGEKLYETLVSREERFNSEDLGGYFRIKPANRDLNYEKYFEKGEISKVSNLSNEYTSHNTHQMNLDEVKNKLLSISFIKESIKKINS